MAHPLRMQRRRVALGLVVALTFGSTLACSATSEDASQVPGTVVPAADAGGAVDVASLCDPFKMPPVASLRRLTSTQYRNTLTDLLTDVLGQRAATLTMLGKSAAFSELPDDVPEAVDDDTKGTYRRLDQSLNAARTEGEYFTAVDLGKALTSGDVITKVVGACATDTLPANDKTCVEDFVRSFAARAFRRPARPEEVTFYRSVYGASLAPNRGAFADVIAAILSAPAFVNLLEHGTTALAQEPGTFLLDPYELASRLSYQLLDTMPDAALLAAAADGSILTDAGYAAQVERLLGDPRARTVVRDFFYDWSRGDDFPELDQRNQDPIFKAFAGAELPSAKLHQEMVDDALDTAAYVIWEKNGSVADLYTTTVNVNRGPELAKIYGAAPWDGQGTPPSFDASRPGLLTRAFYLASGSASTRPIMKGVFVRQRVLCDNVSPPPAGVDITPPALRPDMTSREVVEALTEQPGSSCAGCHKTFFNPIGFATEGFDALGRARTQERLFDVGGKVVGSKPVKTESEPHIDLGSSEPSTGAADLMKQIATSPKATVCLARQYFRFTAGRWDAPGDGCSVQKYVDTLRAGGIKGVLKAAVLDPRFKQRVFHAQ